jgi:N-methylhydantoinase A
MKRKVFDPAAGEILDYEVMERGKLRPGEKVRGPALIVEDQTTTVVTSSFDAYIDEFGNIVLTRRGA